MTDADQALLTALGRFETVLARHGAPIVDHLRDGLPAQTVEELLTTAGVIVTSDLITWFGWHDGAEPDESYGDSFFRGFPFRGLEECLAWHSSDDGRLFADLFEELFGWPRNSMPLFADSDLQTIGHAVLRDGDYRLHLGWYEVPEFTDFGSFPRFVDVMTTAWDRGIIRYDPTMEEVVDDADQLARLLESI